MIQFQRRKTLLTVEAVMKVKCQGTDSEEGKPTVRTDCPKLQMLDTHFVYSQ